MAGPGSRVTSMTAAREHLSNTATDVHGDKIRPSDALTVAAQWRRPGVPDSRDRAPGLLIAMCQVITNSGHEVWKRQSPRSSASAPSPHSIVHGFKLLSNYLLNLGRLAYLAVNCVLKKVELMRVQSLELFYSKGLQLA